MFCSNLVIHIGAPSDTCSSPAGPLEVKTCGHKLGRPLPNAKGGRREERKGNGHKITETNPSLDAHAFREARYGKCHNCEMSEARHKGKSTVDASDTITN